MRSYSLIAPAKINLYLEIIGDRPDGYHELAMVMQSVSLADWVDLRANGIEQFRLSCDSPEIPADENNLAHKAAVLMAQRFPKAYAQFGGVDMTLHKRIPVGAGLAGGSTNAAAVLVGLDLMWGLGLTRMELQELAAELGSDVAFCIGGGTAIATGRGEQLDPLPSVDYLWVVLAKYRSLPISTAWAYKTYRQRFEGTYARDTDSLQQRLERVHAGPMVGAIAQRDGSKIPELLYNDFERVVFPDYPKVAALKQQLLDLGAAGALMSGSGSTVFGLAHSQARAEALTAALREQQPDPDLEIWVGQLIAKGIHLAP
ncbi:4-(cytidine 5'-diphospho)-2-C-methyl-D-erythritol kinase [Thermoleptolyngbya sichuanensis A183]|uniref:4-diphosphocytidyl-2-C-methyl-D-erythritol kinase n=1 Tax=Thermoleptolyngbya sichuanensis A183 TaxID=2737172 RepID=A0A6M8BDA8_9CYAN|nr:MULTISPECIES: 4-(cytidine 5'-diphospho)-2-C-methyl-D-erythritol kinase [Thermoleptolyngbya]QKD82847.1 4-(cytidine 5'-diphospho)-2-C-methyl-D-erythritol kinase [Thermoleptolyngbya sichuanensis A183]